MDGVLFSDADAFWAFALHAHVPAVDYPSRLQRLIAGKRVETTAVSEITRDMMKEIRQFGPWVTLLSEEEQESRMRKAVSAFITHAVAAKINPWH
jgi:phage baseplate assembly protein W